ncbi:AAA family ATPase [Streptomyces sp. PA03-6a]|nr:AAA family ATPase [Streptomyces sp. PA03-6a]
MTTSEEIAKGVDAALARIAQPRSMAPVSVTLSASSSVRMDAYTRKALQAECDAITEARDGVQNDTINRAAFNVGTIVATGALSEDEAREALLAASLAGNHPERRALRSIESGLASGMSQPRHPWPPAPRANDDRNDFSGLLAPEPESEPRHDRVHAMEPEPEAGSAPPSREILLRPASTVRIRRVKWLWDTTPVGAPPTSHGRIPMHSLCIAAGPPGLGKSQYAVWMTARITTGTLPGELYGKPRAVIYAAAEDSWQYTIAPRLIAGGADMDLVFRVDVQDDGQLHARLTVPVDTSILGQAAEEHGVALLVMDPLLSFIDKGINDYRAAEVRQALEPLIAAADRHGFTILGLAHFTKFGSADPLARVAGSGAFGQLIRSLIAFAKQETEDGDVEFVLSLEKNNLGRTGLPSYSYTIQSVTVETEDGPTYVSRFVLGPETSTSVSEVMRDEGSSPADRSETSETRAWLRDYLSDLGGCADSRDVLNDARKQGFSRATIYRAKAKLNLVSRQIGLGKAKRSLWFLPEAVPASEHDGPSDSMRPETTENSGSELRISE